MVLSETDLLCRRVGDVVRDLYRSCSTNSEILGADEGDFAVAFESGMLVSFKVTPHGYGLSLTARAACGPADQRTVSTGRRGIGCPDECCPGTARGPDPWGRYIGRELMGVGELVYRPHRDTAGLCLHFAGAEALYIYDLADEIVIQPEVSREEFAELLLCGRRGDPSDPE